MSCVRSLCALMCLQQAAFAALEREFAPKLQRAQEWKVNHILPYPSVGLSVLVLAMFVSQRDGLVQSRLVGEVQAKLVSANSELQKVRPGLQSPAQPSSEAVHSFLWAPVAVTGSQRAGGPAARQQRHSGARVALDASSARYHLCFGFPEPNRASVCSRAICSWFATCRPSNRRYFLIWLTSVTDRWHSLFGALCCVRVAVFLHVIWRVCVVCSPSTCPVLASLRHLICGVLVLVPADFMRCVLCPRAVFADGGGAGAGGAGAQRGRRAAGAAGGARDRARRRLHPPHGRQRPHHGAGEACVLLLACFSFLVLPEPWRQLLGC